MVYYKMDNAKQPERITQTEQKKLNHKSIYNYIYQERQTCKQAIVSALQFSLPTVTQNLKTLEEHNLIIKDGLYSSNSGRRAQIISCNANAKIAIGVEILKDAINMVAINLYGESLQTQTVFALYENTESYYILLGSKVNHFIDSLPISHELVLGVGIAIQSVISQDGSSIIYGQILQNTGLTLTDFTRHIPYPCVFLHDAKAAAYAEIWFQKIKNAIYIGLNNNIGGAIIINGQIYSGGNSRSGSVEHMCLVPDGTQCYCGRKGCMEVYCSGNYLEQESGISLSDYFKLLRDGDSACLNLWHSYLKYLAFSIDSIRFIVDGTIILGGIIASHFTDADIETLYANIPQVELCGLQLIRGQCNQYAGAIGAALHYIDDFLDHI